MKGLTVVFGAGAIGMRVVRLLQSRGDAVRIAQRNRPGHMPAEVEFCACDILDPAAVRSAVEGASQVLISVGFRYDSRLWRTAWPLAMNNVLDACAAIDARIVFIDNLYQLGPQNEARREDMALTSVGQKPAILAEVTRIWMASLSRVRLAALRCPDFYGPGVDASHIGATGFGRVAQRKSALLLAPPDTPHDFAYVPDIARAVMSLFDAGDDAYGQAWNMPCAPTLTPRQILKLGADAVNRPLKIVAVPLWMMPMLGLFSRFMKEVHDVAFTWDRPYVVDASKFKRRFWSDVTPFDHGAAETARSYVAAAETTQSGLRR
ncbi:MAG: NAD-dependent epimerase/dehydratase family protein [Dokdonella sp.]|uniref:NAD-dependent epimerase/dehydratase family protein n=1 Tax=Dokdonella sp. TaxID=2291710 RepID=UPI0032648834